MYQWFLSYDTKSISEKINKLKLINIKKFGTSKDSVKKEKNQPKA